MRAIRCAPVNMVQANHLIHDPIHITGDTGQCANLIHQYALSGARRPAFQSSTARAIFCPFGVAGLPFALLIDLLLPPFRVGLFCALALNRALLILALLLNVTL